MTNTIWFFLCWVKEVSLVVWPAIIMTDHDQAQMAAIEDVYLESQTLLCMWHVLCAMCSHFATNEFPALWEKIKAWVNTDDPAEFYQLWGMISSDPSIPQSVVQHLTVEWLKVPHLWSKVARKGQNIFEKGDTNMLIEAYVYAAMIDKIR
jgi:MULE transposase domain